MEEKERFELNDNDCILDNEKGVAICDVCDVGESPKILVDLLNEQDQRIKELEQENKELKDFTENTANLIDKLTEDSVFASTQLAISELVKIKRYIDDNAYYIDELNFGEEINEYIDNQIKELGGGDNEKDTTIN